MDWKSHKIEVLLEQALIEDHAAEDATAHLAIDPNLRAAASIVAREDMVVAGLGAIPRIFEIYARLDPHPQAKTRFEVVSHPEIFDGVRAHKGQVLAVIRHNAQAILACERVILNLLAHLSGIATLTRQFADAIQGTKAHVLDTRKTVPGLRVLDKYAVLCGGGTNHRIDLPTGILVKSNHIALGGGMAAVMSRVLASRKPGQRVEVEVRTLAQLEEAIANGAEALLFEDMTPKTVRRAMERVHKEERWIPTEASGSIPIEQARAYADAGVEFISVGALTHSARSVRLAMNIVPE
jgi:nicotinate-nucleotide pyrophosphorylase (carboxylating)